MSNSLGIGPALLMPPSVLQPFPLRFRRDDLHVMASSKVIRNTRPSKP